LVLVTSGDARGRRAMMEYVFVNWGPEFEADHALAFPNLRHPGLSLDLGTLGVSYLLSTRGSGYFPMRVARVYIDSGELQMVRRAPRFVYPAYAVYPEDRDEEAYEPILQGLKQVVSTM
jgi:LysR family transcriptional regulator, flagellar master operon regulator